ncbi:MAG: 50S ribosomal protein L22 [Candidatus Margulisiibacteriota bacterium]|nr:ribosomal protein L22 [uncultured bacterium]OGH99631.1 MAG: 50S ribosomal protein L22 [Candidatus Margulisbacteria bacterium GWD2_39_127]OGI04636.1 MAG: 50S ribosomal protein L22 [Candidatus Margulisbacteria bacterium GWF2_38_17]OGI11832.1 MAG: 50S ribosomal protein L22 [Candidatus Margulisbacteria bacterium GWE2_39_32]PZM79796.1 MAG: 50S ribosomal protein L22 [Candidatus Margulisiibacteriota bacterium]
MEVVAKAKYLRISPRKVNRVLAVIRNKEVSVSMNILKLLPHAAARVVLKTLKSAVANAKNNADLTVGNLVISQAIVGEGLRMKRFQPMARGSAGAILKRTSNITIAVKSREVK